MLDALWETTPSSPERSEGETAAGNESQQERDELSDYTMVGTIHLFFTAEQPPSEAMRLEVLTH